MSHARKVNFLPGFALEGYPNRDSTIYKELYGIPEAKTVLRGTLRYQGFSEAIRSLLAIGLIDTNSHHALHPKGPEISWVSPSFHTVGSVLFLSCSGCTLFSCHQFLLGDEANCLAFLFTCRGNSFATCSRSQIPVYSMRTCGQGSWIVLVRSIV